LAVTPERSALGRIIWPGRRRREHVKLGNYNTYRKRIPLRQPADRDDAKRGEMKSGAANVILRNEVTKDLFVCRAALVSFPQIVIPKRSEGSPLARLTGQNLISGLGAAHSLAIVSISSESLVL